MIDLIQKRLAEYDAANQVEEAYAIKEILQDIALYGLWRADFFEVAGFQGGTSLRILHGMKRFSEHLDFILKIHALLCRPYLKGRDWFDFSWYVTQGAQVNLPHLRAALVQWGPWANQKIDLNLKWLKRELIQKASSIEWQSAAADVQPFLRPSEQHGLRLWSEKFFVHKIEDLTPHQSGPTPDLY